MKTNNPKASGGPLLSWDIFMLGYTQRMYYSEDIQGLRKLMGDTACKVNSAAAVENLIWHNKVVIITDTKLKIVYASKNLTGMTGYKPNEVIGNTPKMFQGEATTAETRAVIRKGIDNQEPFDVIITNYKKDGSLYKCHVEGYPVFDRNNDLVNFIAFENAA